MINKEKKILPGVQGFMIWILPGWDNNPSDQVFGTLDDIKSAEFAPIKSTKCTSTYNNYLLIKTKKNSLFIVPIIYFGEQIPSSSSTPNGNPQRISTSDNYPDPIDYDKFNVYEQSPKSTKKFALSVLWDDSKKLNITKDSIKTIPAVQSILDKNTNIYFQINNNDNKPNHYIGIKNTNYSKTEETKDSESTIFNDFLLPFQNPKKSLGKYNPFDINGGYTTFKGCKN